MRVILHVDMDAFYAAVEQRDHPEYRGKPVVVGADPKGGRGRGVVAACSYEARRFGLRSAMPISQAYRRCPDAVFVRPDLALYSRVSGEIMAILSRFSSRVEQISIDEAFLDATGLERLFGPPRKLARRIKETLLEEQQLTCSIGIAPNKFLAKLASDLCKPDGLLEVSPGQEETYLQDLPIRHIWGIGPKTESRIRQLGIRTIGEVARRPLSFWQQLLGSRGEQIWRLSHGLDDRPVHTERGFKSLSREMTFMEDTDDLDEIRRTLLNLSEHVARRLSRYGVLAGCISLKLRYADFSTFTRQKSLQEPTADARAVAGIGRSLLEKFLPLQQKVRLLGIEASRFQEGSQEQGRLFGPPDEARDRTKLLRAGVEAIVARFGEDAIRRASLIGSPRKKP